MVLTQQTRSLYNSSSFNRRKWKASPFSVEHLPAGPHKGTNIAAAAIILEFDLQNRARYFILDSAENDDICVQAIGKLFKFKWKELPWLCYQFGSSPDSLRQKSWREGQRA
jgi:hypothetical protein